MSQIIPPPFKVEFPEQIALSDRIDGERTNVAASEKAVGALNQKVNSLEGYQSGDIKIHNGTIATIPSGWVLCDGANGTPPMVDRAIVGAGGQYQPKQVFGSDVRGTESRTLSAGQMPSHGHRQSGDDWGGRGSNRVIVHTNGARKAYSTHAAGGNQPHNHGNIDVRQKSIALIWIMKL
ncbi:hypothetical protein [Vibrio scophthalmi]|uniref:Phage tail collar domain-containing protein n=1 Tax=Vibrio scophthalmi TaxID=45658 RepID=A0A1E3WHC4_9VIBR|nr:hypothetical protein [Vibrio scophthalmi]ODS05208.1 hypothetical protein VSF3289_04349 [Vibrio scophthalmi]ODS12589.1 hypothetical protein VSF3289_02914 [Vibrio scophthalmi]